ncbi:hemin ABC transporter substrate-binding protein [Salmonella enterica subsp. enterica serovar Choleraesuis]|nr:hemin ABC transporter substrate-binding protein [Salmonella enterica subsp. enterica serovar Choleraesuis]
MKRVLLALAALPSLAFAAPERVVSLGGDVTEIAVALGAESTLVGRDATSLYPATVKKVPDVGYLRQLSAEGVLALRPELILASEEAGPPVVLKQLENSGVKVADIPAPKKISDIPAKVTAVANALDKRSQGEALNQRLNKEIAALPKTTLNKKVLFIMSHGGMSAMAAGQGTAADAAIQAAGLKNAMQGFVRYQTLSQEGVIQSQPDLVLVTTDGVATLGGKDKVWSLPGLAQTPAGKNQQLMVVDDMALLGFGPRTPETVRVLRERAEQLP